MTSAVGSWQPVRRQRSYEHVLEAIEDQIMRGNFAPGDRLPSERDLSAMLEVSRPSVREALRVLESMGVIVAGVGSGENAGSVITGRASVALSGVLRIHLALANFSLADVVATRTAIEAAAVAAAATHATGDDVADLLAIVEQMDPSAPEMEPRVFNELDTNFHVRVAEASGNSLLAELMQALRDAVHQEMVRAFERLDDWQDIAVKLQDEHREIVGAIEAHDPVAASSSVTNHIEAFYRSTL